MTYFFCHTDTPCHTERSEVSINQSANLHFKSMDFFAAATPCNPLGRYAQNDKVRRHCKMTKCVFFVRHCEPFSQKWRGNPKIRLDFCPKFKAKIKKGEML